MRLLIRVFLALAVAAALALALAIGLGGPGEPPAMASINAPFEAVDFSDLPELSRFEARDGIPLAYLSYSPWAGDARGSVVLVHGSSAAARTLHPIAREFARAGYAVYVPDIRGHGESGKRGRIDYIGQLEHDLADFIDAVEMPRPLTLAGFSAGGGFALRFAGSDRQTLFDGYMLLAPFLGAEAPTYRPDAGGWVNVGNARLIAIAVCDALGLRVFNDLPVVRFALDDEAKDFLTPQYNFSLAMNFAPERDYLANIRAVRQPMVVVAGEEDEVFYSERIASVFEAAGRDLSIEILPGIDHVGLTLEPTAIAAAIAALPRSGQQGVGDD